MYFIVQAQQSQRIIEQSNPVVIYARIVDSAGTPIQQSEVTEIAISVWNMETSTSTFTSTASGSNYVSNSLSTINWTTDAVGYNLLVLVGADAFPDANATYQIQIQINQSAGDPFTVVSLSCTQPVYS